MALCKAMILVGVLLLVLALPKRIRQVNEITPHQHEEMMEHEGDATQKTMKQVAEQAQEEFAEALVEEDMYKVQIGKVEETATDEATAAPGVALAGRELPQFPGGLYKAPGARPRLSWADEVEESGLIADTGVEFPWQRDPGGQTVNHRSPVATKTQAAKMVQPLKRQTPDRSSPRSFPRSIPESPSSRFPESPSSRFPEQGASSRFDMSRVQPLGSHIPDRFSPRTPERPSSRSPNIPDRFSPKKPESRVKDKGKGGGKDKGTGGQKEPQTVKGKGSPKAKAKVIWPLQTGKFGVYPVMDGRWKVTRLSFLRGGFSGLIYQEVPTSKTLLIQSGQAVEEFGHEAIIPLWDNSVEAKVGDKISFDIGSLAQEGDGKASPMATNVIIRERGRAVKEAIVKGPAPAVAKQGAVSPKAVAKKTKEAIVKGPVLAAAKQGAVAPKAVAKPSAKDPVGAKKTKEATVKGPALAAAKQGAVSPKAVAKKSTEAPALAKKTKTKVIVKPVGDLVKETADLPALAKKTKAKVTVKPVADLLKEIEDLKKLVQQDQDELAPAAPNEKKKLGGKMRQRAKKAELKAQQAAGAEGPRAPEERSSGSDDWASNKTYTAEKVRSAVSPAKKKPTQEFYNVAVGKKKTIGKIVEQHQEKPAGAAKNLVPERAKAKERLSRLKANTAKAKVGSKKVAA